MCTATSSPLTLRSANRCRGLAPRRTTATTTAVSYWPHLCFIKLEVSFVSNMRRLGQSTITARREDPCHDKTFLTDYAACLACAGPGNYGIWMYYGGVLSKTASSCNLPHTPGTDESLDVPVAIPAAKYSSTATTPTTTAPRESDATTDVRVSTSPPSTTSGPIAAFGF